jgi:hypothetical protein
MTKSIAAIWLRDAPVRRAFVMVSESLALSGIQSIEAFLSIRKEETIRDSSTSLGMTMLWACQPATHWLLRL